MKIINIKNKDNYLKEYVTLCALEWHKQKDNEDLNLYIKTKINKIKIEDEIISILGLINNNTLIGFISLFKHDGKEKTNLTPWYATMYVKKEYRNQNYSKILNKAILKEAKKLGYSKVYLKSNLENYYEKFGAKYIETLNNKEKLFVINL